MLHICGKSLLLLVLSICMGTMFGCGAGKSIRLQWPERMEVDNAMLVRGLAVSEDGTQLGLVSEDHAVAVIDESSEAPSWVLHRVLPRKLFDTPTSIRFTSDGKQLLAYNQTHLARINVSDGSYKTEHVKLRVTDPLKISTALSPDGKQRAVGYMHGSLEVYDTETHEKVLDLKGHSDAARIVADYSLLAGVWMTPSRGATKITAVSYSRDGRYLVSGDGVGGVRVWDVKEGKMHADLLQRNLILMNRVLWLEMSPDNRYVAAGTASDVRDKITVIDVASKEKVLEVHGVKLSGLWLWSPKNPMPADILTDFSPNGKYFYCPKGETIEVWDLAQRKVVKTLRGHTDDVLTVAVTPDGNWLCSAAEDRTGRIWDLQTGECVTLFVVLPKGEYIYFDVAGDEATFYESGRAAEHYQRERQ